MKIHPDQLQALEQEQAKSKSAQQADKGFGELLAREVEGSASGDAARSAALPPLGGTALSGNILAAQAASGEPSESGQEVMERLESLLGDWETYASSLGSAGGASLRQANGALENIESEVASLKETMSGKDADGELKAVLDEVEILAVTERIKFNRGDYI
ncbi:hypothetical protein [Desulfocurvus sp. DL9XJH121]